MKTLMLTLATVATLVAGAAHAADTSGSNGEVRTFDSNPQTLFGGLTLDREPTASIGSAVSAGQVFTGIERIHGREANVRYMIVDGQKKIISKSFRSSDR